MPSHKSLTSHLSFISSRKKIVNPSKATAVLPIRTSPESSSTPLCHSPEVFQGTLILKTQRKKRFHTQESGGEDSVPNRLRPLVDVRDVAEAVIMAYEKPEAEGRYICVAHAIKTRDLAEKLRRLYPDFT
ncbi:cinnamoyl-CoA reductase 1-like [Punica granatum]|uniref:Cinnamoyl-CoA reductase 1-like n=1 Tax=Punica granatum TaxID=22663 RepID=A0A6P8DYP8_PUNGR|nr:cinnamoyl-CoA reductase 1-like [Punica granatum]